MNIKPTGLALLLIILLVKFSESQVSFSEQLIISNNAQEAMFVYAADLDMDGDQDVISSSGGDNKIAWYENMNGSGTFGAENIITLDKELPNCVIAVDIDNDNDMDIVSASYLSDSFTWFENMNGNGDFSLKQIISNIADGAISVFATDIDNDEDPDIVGASWENNQIAWFENTDGQGNFSSGILVSSIATGVRYVFCADLDNDNDNDIVAALSGSDKVVWYENTDGAGNFSGEIVISSETDNVLCVSAADLDNDGDFDVISASSFDNKIAWYENLNGQGEFGTQQIITNQATGAFHIYIADLDNDSDQDIVTAYSDNVVWFENLDGLGNFSNQNLITSNAQAAHCVFSCDIDNDNDFDVLSASWGDDKIAWYRNEMISSVSENKNNSSNVRLIENFPNPFNQSTTIKYLLALRGHLKLTITDSSGKPIKTLVNKKHQKGEHEIIWNGTDNSGISVPPGLYYCRIQAGKEIQSCKMCLMK